MMSNFVCLFVLFPGQRQYDLISCWVMLHVQYAQALLEEAYTSYIVPWCHQTWLKCIIRWLYILIAQSIFIYGSHSVCCQLTCSMMALITN